MLAPVCSCTRWVCGSLSLIVSYLSLEFARSFFRSLGSRFASAPGAAGPGRSSLAALAPAASFLMYFQLKPFQVEIPEDEGKRRSEEHTSELQSIMRTSYPVFC